MVRVNQVADRDREFTAYYAEHGPGVRKLAYVLCGDWHRAEDLTQIAFTKIYSAWYRIQNPESMDGYVRRVLVRSFLDDQRRTWRREYATEPSAPVFGQDLSDPDPGRRLDLQEALRAVAPKQRAVLVLRFWLDLSVEQTAAAMGCSAGNVKSQTARGLVTLRAALVRRDAAHA